MSNIAEKLTYLNDTKSLLKDSINSLGGEITSQTTFRQYATELNSIYSKLPKVTGTGSILSLSPTIKGRLGSVLKGNTLQDGTPSPSSPVEIQSATGLQTINVNNGTNAQTKELNLGKNLFDGSLFNSLTANSDGTYKTNTAYTAASNVPFKLKPNTNYVISLRDENYDLISGDFGIYVDDVYVGASTIGNYKFTTSSNNITNIKVAASGWSTVGVVNRYIQLEENTQATSYSPYFTPIYLRKSKDGTYEDYITGSPNNWSIKRQIGSVVLDGTETWYKANENINVWVNNLANSHGTDRKYTNSRGDFVCNYFSYLGDAQLENLGNAMSFNVSNAYKDSVYIQIDPNIASSNSELKSWLSTHNTIVDYVLATETTEPITNQEIINQLNEIYFLQSYNGTTNITITSADLELIMTASALKGE